MNRINKKSLTFSLAVRLILSGIFATILVACSSKDSDFLDTINQDQEKLKICIKMTDLGVNIWEFSNKYYLAAQPEQSTWGDVSYPIMALEALKEAGYVITKPFSFAYRRSNLTGHQLTSKGSEYFIWEKPLCIANRKVASDIEYIENNGNFTTATFKYAIIFNDLIKDTKLEEALLSRWKEKGRYDGNGNASFVKTNKGWSLQNLSW